MKKLLLIAAALSVTPLHAGRIQTDEEAVQLFMRGGGACSGTLIGVDTVLTAGHCVLDDKAPIAVNKRRTKSILLTPVKVDKARDLALLTRNGRSPDLSRINLGSEDVEEGETITAVGFGLGLPDKDEISGRVVGLTPHPLFPRVLAIASDGTSIPGMSGGPVIDSEDRLIGVVSAGNDATQSDSIRKVRSLFIPVTEINNFLKAKTQKDSVNVVGSELSPEEDLMNIINQLVYKGLRDMKPLDKVVTGENDNDKKLNRTAVRKTR